jgi:RNA polymerase sigma-70 factor (ECF subfamily)
MTIAARPPALRETRLAFRGELADFADFYESTYQGAYRTALGILRDAGAAAEATQDAYVSAYRQRGRFRGDAPARVWLHQIVVNAALAAVRRRKPSGPREIEVVDAEADADVARVAERASILAALDALTPRQRAAVVLRYYQDYDYATIARILGTTPGNVGAILSRSLDRLRIELAPPSESPAADLHPSGGGSHER